MEQYPTNHHLQAYKPSHEMLRLQSIQMEDIRIIKTLTLKLLP